ncbi:LysR family transcriptional regulator [Labrys wisconsinensis]|uniref:DNA-binding transcriptional LysR family regulator n=1 Tax=Labrys wisconsinensis TaxID=425677 RepID=A0ABU0J1Q7_9HYPH|nr:LysR family transcriptional regulator [Labrys wisconsinensis]MDQ0467383.1 DNA-binding transcriptional LysR family regulator [Labrys wisconsinensis]
MTRNIDTGLLRAFIAVAETAGMTAAANVLNLTQAAISQQIKRLEDGFEARLFERDRKGLRLTNAGERLFGKAKRMLALNDEIWAEMTVPIHSGEVRLGIPYDLVNTYLPPVLRGFSRAYPNVRVTLVCEPSLKLLETLQAGQIDLTLVEQPQASAGAETLAIDRLVWVGARGGEAHRKRPLPVSLGAETCIFRPAIVAALAGADISWWAMSEIGGAEVMNATVETDLAVMALMAATVPGHLEILGPQSGLPPLQPYSIALHMSRARPSAVVEELARFIRDGFRSRQRQAA